MVLIKMILIIVNLSKATRILGFQWQHEEKIIEDISVFHYNRDGRRLCPRPVADLVRDTF